MEVKLESLEKEIGYFFKNIDLLKTSLVHRSFGNENKKYKKINNAVSYTHLTLPTT